MKSINICVDIDGTITDAYYWIGLANKYFKRTISEEDVSDYEMHKVFKVTQEEYMKFYNKHIYEIHEQAQIRDNVKCTLDKVSKMSYIHFVTARDKRLELLTTKFLNENKIVYDNLFLLGTHYKVDKAKELNCDIFIEDNYNNAIQLSEAGFDVILMDTNYNQNEINEKIIRVKDWIEIDKILNNLGLEKIS